MIKRNSINTEIDGDDFEGVDASIDQENLGFMFDIVSKQMYRRPINSIVREITSNCFDSHIEANVDDPVIITLANDEGGDYITFKDVGVGISPERMDKIYSKWFSSSKRGSNDMIGMFGLGSKSPLAYTDSFFVTTIYDKIQYEYLVHSGKTKPRIEKLLTTEGVEDRNQTEVKIYMKSTLDTFAFKNACISELLYFDNVFFESKLYSITNDYKIFDYNTFKYRPDLKYSDRLHIIIGKVPYPINWEELNRKEIKIPVGLKFNIGDLEVTPERESLRYIDIEQEDGVFVATKDIINKKIDEFVVEISALYNKDIESEFEDYREFLEYGKDKESWLKIDEQTKLNVSSAVVKPAGVFIPLKDFRGKIPNNILFNIKVDYEYVKGRKPRAFSSVSLDYEKADRLTVVAPKSGKLQAKKMQYLYDYAKEITGYSEFYFVREEYIEITSWKRILDLKSTNNLNNTNLLKQYKMFRDFQRFEFNRLTFKYEDIKISEEWLALRKTEQDTKLKREEDSFLVYNYGNVIISDNKLYLTIKKLKEFTGFLIYGYDKDEELLKNFRDVFINSKYSASGNHRYIDPKKCLLVRTAQRNTKHFLEIKNAIYIYDFMGDNKVFKRIATTAMLAKDNKALKLTGHTGGNSDNAISFQIMLDQIFPPAADALRELRVACRDYGNMLNEEKSVDFINQLISIASEYNLYDKELLETHNKLEKYVEGLELINYIVLNSKSLPLVVDFLLLKNKPVATLWKGLEKYEIDLINESVDKATYLLDIYSDHREQSRDYNKRKKLVSIKTQDTCNQVIDMCTEQNKFYNSLKKYYDNKDKSSTYSN